MKKEKKMGDLADADEHLHLVPLCVLCPEPGKPALLLPPRGQQRLVLPRPPLEQPVAVDEVHHVGAQLHLGRHAAQVHQLEEFPLDASHPGAQRPRVSD